MEETEQEQLPCAEKLVFDSQKAAQAAATTIKHQRGIHLKPYVCQHCGLWHLATVYND